MLDLPWTKYLTRIALAFLVFQIGRYAVEVAAPERSFEARKYAEGDVIANVNLLAEDGTETSVATVASGHCQVLIVFDELCPVCHHLAEDWTSRPDVPEDVSVVWISVPGPPEAPERFVSEYGLERPWYRLRSDEDVAAIGGYGTPMLLFLGPDQVFLGHQMGRPDSITLPLSCER